MYYKSIIIFLCFAVISCSIKEIFVPMDTIILNNDYNMNLNVVIKTKKINRKFTIARGIFYEKNGIRYNMIHNSTSLQLKENDQIILLQVERNEEINILYSVKNVIDDIIATDQNGNIIFLLNNIAEENFENIMLPVNNWRKFKINMNNKPIETPIL